MTSSRWYRFVRFAPAAFAALFFVELAGTGIRSWAQGAGKPAGLQCESLIEPLGLDAAKPMLSWKLSDPRRGARQSAYQVRVYSRSPQPGDPKPDIWDSGRIASEVSTGVAYAGPALAPGKRYFWRVQLWDADGKPYPESDASWWETGLLNQANWHGEWIGYEEPELHSVRESGAVWITNAAPPAGQPQQAPHDVHHDFLLRFQLDKPVARAALYTTGEDTAAAWVNGQPVLRSQPLVPWKQMPWGTYERVDVTRALKSGDNLLAIGVTRYQVSLTAPVPTQSPMSAVLHLTFQDGSTQLLTSKAGTWTATIEAPDGWWNAGASNSSWKPAELYSPVAASVGSGASGLPWPTGPVSALRKTFDARRKALSRPGCTRPPWAPTSST